jgi:hypothetical protein
MQQLPATVPPPPPPHVFRRSAATWSGVHTRALLPSHRLRSASGMWQCAAVVFCSCRRFGRLYRQRLLQTTHTCCSSSAGRSTFHHHRLLSVFSNFHNCCEAQSASTAIVFGVGIVTWPWPPIHRSPPSSAEVRNEWSYRSSPPYVFLLSTGTAVPFSEALHVNSKMNL